MRSADRCGDLCKPQNEANNSIGHRRPDNRHDVVEEQGKNEQALECENGIGMNGGGNGRSVVSVEYMEEAREGENE